MHWIVRAVRRAGLPGAEGLELAPDVSVKEAWAEAGRGCGVDPPRLAEALAGAFGMDVADTTATMPTAVKLLPASVVRAHSVYPLRDDDRVLWVATSGPVHPDAEQEIGFASGRQPRFAVAPPDWIEEAVENAYAPEAAAASMLGRIKADFKGAGEVSVEMAADEGPEEIPETDVAAGPVVKLTNIVLHEAISRGASDIHIQPMQGHGVVRYRTDGVLHTGMQFPLPVMTRVVSRIKIMAKLDITDRLRPQDGRAKIHVEGKKYDLRVSTVPTRQVEKAVVRVLDTGGSGTLAETGIVARELGRIRRALTHRDGIFVVTGPTGSGKTTTMYGALQEIATDDINIMTVEDPVEYELPRLTQIQVEHRQGMTFASALRAILRQDPDVIFVGEIRDDETAEVAAQASLTGHLVLATLHTNDAVGAIRRFVDLGLDVATVAETLRGVLAQRLIRKVCPSCAIQLAGTLTSEEQALVHRYGVAPRVRAVGCEECFGSGYAGRIPLTEFLTPTPELVSLMLAGASPFELEKQATADGMVPLLRAALDRVAAGETTLAEVERVVGLEDSTAAEDDPAERAAGELEAPAAASDVLSPIGGRGMPGAEAAVAVADPRTRRPKPTVVAGGAVETAGPRLQADADPPDEDKPHILVVDDDGTTRSIARGLLERNLGCLVSEAADGAEALVRLARGDLFSLILLDLDMPTLGGREVLRSVRQSMVTAGLPVVVLTGTPDPDSEIELMEMGADDYLRKPLDPARLQARVRAALRRASG